MGPACRLARAVARIGRTSGVLRLFDPMRSKCGRSAAGDKFRCSGSPVPWWCCATASCLVCGSRQRRLPQAVAATTVPLRAGRRDGCRAGVGLSLLHPATTRDGDGQTLPARCQSQPRHSVPAVSPAMYPRYSFRPRLVPSKSTSLASIYWCIECSRRW